MSGLELNKIAASILLAGVVAMLAGFAAEKLYAPEIPEKRGYQVEGVANAGSDTGAAPAQEVDIVTLLASADAAQGAAVAKKCMTCHTFEKGGANKIGPNLWGVLGNQFAHKADFAYSDAFKKLSGGWDYDNLAKFVQNPQGYVKGTKMSFAGIRKPEDVANLLAYIRTMGDTQPPLPQPKQ